VLVLIIVAVQPCKEHMLHLTLLILLSSSIFLSAFLYFFSSSFSRVDNTDWYDNDSKENVSYDLDYQIYDLVDRMSKLTKAKSFYDILNVPFSANTSTIASAFRKKSMVWHPDKNQADPQSEAKYSLLASISQILKDEASRTRYNWILKEAPVWHKSGCYMRRYMTAKLSITQVLILLFVFITLLQFLMESGAFLILLYRRWSARSRHSILNKNQLKVLDRKIGKCKSILLPFSSLFSIFISSKNNQFNHDGAVTRIRRLDYIEFPFAAL
jgi:DnaJ domain